MRLSVRTVLLSLILVAGWVPGVLAQERVEVGTRIYPKSRDVAIRTKDEVVGKGDDVSLPLSVREVNGDWLLIWVYRKTKEAWIHRNDVCTAHEAMSYFTNQISTDPNETYYYF